MFFPQLLFGLSALGLCIGLGSMGIFAYYKKLNYDVSDLSWIPLFCFSFTIFVGNIGVLNLPYLIIAEILPVKVRWLTPPNVFVLLSLRFLFQIKDFAMTSIMIVSWTFSFLSVKVSSQFKLVGESFSNLFPFYSDIIPIDAAIRNAWDARHFLNRVLHRSHFCDSLCTGNEGPKLWSHHGNAWEMKLFVIRLIKSN